MRIKVHFRQVIYLHVYILLRSTYPLHLRYVACASFPLSSFFPLSLDYLFVSGMWVWLIATLVRDVCRDLDLKDLFAAQSVREFLIEPIYDDVSKLGSSAITTRIPETQLDAATSLVTIAPRKRQDTSRFLNEPVPRPTKRSKVVKMSRKTPTSSDAARSKVVDTTTLYPDFDEVEKICQTVVANGSTQQAIDSMAKANMSVEMQKFGTELTVHMAGAYAALRQPILTRQYLGLVEFPGVATATSLFYAHDFWYGETLLRPYFSKFHLVLSTERVQVVLAPLFGVRACFHLQMLHDYAMPVSGEAWLHASNEWASTCSLDSPSTTHCFRITNPHSKRVVNVQAAIRAWVHYDAQFYLGDGVFTLAPTNVFLAMNGVSPLARYENEQEYCKMVIKKTPAEASVPPSPMWKDFWKDNAHLLSFLDATTLTTNNEGEVVAVNVPRVWTEPIPGLRCYLPI